MTTSERNKRRKMYTRQFYKGNMGNFFLTFLQIVSVVIMNLMISWLMQVLIDLTTGADNSYTLMDVLGFLGIAIFVFGFGMWLGWLGRPRFVAKAIGQYKEYVFQKISQKGIAAFAGEQTSFYISALSNDANSIEMDYLCNIIVLINEVLMFAGAFVMMLWYSPILTFVGIGLALLPVAASILSGNRVAEAEEKLSEKNVAYMSALTDSLSGFSVVKSFKAEAAMCRLFAERIKETTHAKTLRRKMMILVSSLGNIAGIIAQCGVFIVGAAMAQNGYPISAGTVIAFVNLMNYVVNPIGTVPQYLAQCKASQALIDKLADSLEENIRDEGGVRKHTLTDSITLKNVSFGYEEQKPVLRNVSFSFEAGKSYAIVGGSGSGKSTLLNLLMASYHGYSGSVSYDDTDLREIDSESLYEMISVIQQNVFVFNASIRDNITMFSPFPKDAVDNAMELSGLSKLIADRGEDYNCGENGSGLSGGEKQRISIARSLLKKSQVLLADEATAALDLQTAFQVSNAILDLEDLTRIVVTHSLEESVLKRYDCILTLKNGSIAEFGSFEELMEKKGYFYSLFTVSQ